MKQMIRGNKDISEETRIAMRVSVISIVINLLLSLLKLAAGLIAKSEAMVSDAVHSASDVFSTFIVMIGVAVSGKNRIPGIRMGMNAWSAWLHCSGNYSCGDRNRNRRVGNRENNVGRSRSASGTGKAGAGSRCFIHTCERVDVLVYKGCR